MTRSQNARVAGFAFLFYIAVGLSQMVVGRGVNAGGDVPAKLASLVSHAARVETNAFLGLVTAFTALVLAAALYGLTRDEDTDLAILALSCRIGEGLLGAVPSIVSLTLLSLASSAITDAAGTATVATALFRVRTLSTLVGSLFFAVGSTLFAWLMLKGNVVPRILAWLGVVSSLLLVVALPLQLVGLLHGAITQLIWVPEAAFEIPVGLWLLITGGGRSRRAPGTADI